MRDDRVLERRRVTKDEHLAGAGSGLSREDHIPDALPLTDGHVAKEPVLGIALVTVVGEAVASHDQRPRRWHHVQRGTDRDAELLLIESPNDRVRAEVVAAEPAGAQWDRRVEVQGDAVGLEQLVRRIPDHLTTRVVTQDEQRATISDELPDSGLLRLAHPVREIDHDESAGVLEGVAGHFVYDARLVAGRLEISGHEAEPADLVQTVLAEDGKIVSHPAAVEEDDTRIGRSRWRVESQDQCGGGEKDSGSQGDAHGSPVEIERGRLAHGSREPVRGHGHEHDQKEEEPVVVRTGERLQQVTRSGPPTTSRSIPTRPHRRSRTRRPLLPLQRS